MTFINTTMTTSGADTYTLVFASSLALGSNGSLICTDGNFAGLRLQGGNNVIIDGQVFSQDHNAIVQAFGSTQVAIDIGPTGVVRTFGADKAAIQLGGTGTNTLTNRGLISSNDTGVGVLLAGQNEVTNFGTIDSAKAYGVWFNSTTGIVNSLVNHGTILGYGYSIVGGDGIGNITNLGFLDSGVSLGAGHDNFNTKHGTMNGAIYGGAGNGMLIGSAEGEYIVGGEDHDWLEGGGGVDTMSGGSGDDTYYTDGLDDLSEDTGSGYDRVRSTGSYQLEDGFEELTLTGSGNINGGGNSQDNELNGNTGNNVLNGKGGADEMYGSLGDDTYITDGNDTILDNQGFDVVFSDATYTPTSNLDNLTLTGSQAINGTGNAIANTIIGNAAANRIDGGGGSDTMNAGLGNDTYVTDGGDTITDDGGIDLVESSVSYVLGGDLDYLTLTGAAAIDGTGNTGANVITGNNAANVLDGGGGLDSLFGGLGNDTYVTDGFDFISDTGGTDLIQASISFSLTSGFENLVLTGATAASGTGNALANSITGNGATNVIAGGAGNDALGGGGGIDRLLGGAGNDTLSGGVGNDALAGNAGKDFFLFANALNAKTNVDRILDFNVAADTIQLENAVFKTLTKAGKLSNAAFHKSTAGVAHDANDRIVYETDTGKLFYDSNGSANGGAVQFATLAKGLALTAADFLVI